MIHKPEFWSDKKVLVTGGAGFIGTHLCNRLSSLGATVHVFVHKNQTKFPSFVGDLADYKSSLNLKSYMAYEKFDAVFHLAAQPIVQRAMEDIIETLDINIRGTYNLYHACIGLKSIQTICHVSTDKIFGELTTITEKDIPNGTEHPYNASKLSGDIMARMFSNTFDLPIAIVRNGNIYGAGDNHFERIMPNVICRVGLGKTPVIRGDGTSTRDYIHVSEIVDGYLNAAERQWGIPVCETYNLGSFRSYSTQEVVDTILAVMGRIDIIPKHEKELQGELKHQHISDPTSDRIGWKPQIDLETGLKLTVPYYLEYLKEKSSV